MSWNAVVQFFTKLFSSTPKQVTEVTDPPKSAPAPETKPSDTSAPAQGTPTSSTGEPDYLQEARTHLGQKEIPGPKSNPFYNELFKDVLDKNYGDETSSCMAFLMALAKRKGYKYLKTAWAADLTKLPGIVGDPKNPQLYQFAIKFSTAANSKRHAFIIVKVNKAKGTVIGLGANQGDTVCEKEFLISDLRHVVTPVKATATTPTGPVTVGRPLAWGKEHSTWDSALKAEILKFDWTGIKMPLPFPPVECVAQLISIMAKYESNFDPKTKYAESGHLAGVTSRGLLQISVDSANQSAYGFNVTADQLHDPLINLKVAVKIMHYQAKKHGVLFDGSKTSGAGAYWSVGRVTSGSFSKIKAYLNTL